MFFQDVQLQPFTDRLLSDLGGNAFNGSCFQARDLVCDSGAACCA